MRYNNVIIIDKTGGLRPYKKGRYSFSIKHRDRHIEFLEAKTKGFYKSICSNDIEQIIIDII